MSPVAGEASLRSDLKAERNDLKVDTKIRINGLSLVSPKELSSSEPRDWGPALLLGLLNAQGEIVLDIAFKTKLDEPKFENVAIEHASLGPSGASVIPAISPETIEGYKKIGEEFKAMGKEFKTIFKKEGQSATSAPVHEPAGT